MKKRTITGLVMLIIFIPLLIENDLFPLFQVLMGGLALIASHELIKMFEKSKKFPGISKWIIMICTILIYLSTVAQWEGEKLQHGNSLSYQMLKALNINIGFLPMLLLSTIILFSMLVIYTDFDGADIGKALTIIIYAGVGFGSLTCLRATGLRFVLYMFIVTVSTDVFAYIVGSLFGKHKMCPHISPHKSWEGSIGGTFVATVLGTLFAVFYGKLFAKSFGPASIDSSLLEEAFFFNPVFLAKRNQVEIVFILFSLTLFVSITSQLGDLVASKLKRTYGLKDYGNIFPGHGGVLDRLDSALFAAMFLLVVFTMLSGLTNTLM